MPKKPTRIEMETAEFSDDDLIEAQIPRRYWSLDRTDYYGDPMTLAHVENYALSCKDAIDTGVSLLLRGPSNSGKTFLLTYLLRCLMAKKADVMYLSLDHLTDLLLNPMVDQEKFNVKFSRLDFVAVDDCDSTEKGPIAALRKFVQIRRDNALPFLLSTSLAEVDGTDLFESAYPKTAQKVLELSHDIKCFADSFRTEKHYNALKKRVRI